MLKFKEDGINGFLDKIKDSSTETVRIIIFKAAKNVAEKFKTDPEGALILIYRIFECYKVLARRQEPIDEKQRQTLKDLAKKLEGTIDFSKFEPPKPQRVIVEKQSQEPSKIWISMEAFLNKLPDHNQIFIQLGILLLNNAKTINSQNIYYISENKLITFQSVFRNLIKENPNMNSTIFCFDESSGASLVVENTPLVSTIDEKHPLPDIVRNLQAFLSEHYPNLNLRMLAGGLTHFGKSYPSEMKRIGSAESARKPETSPDVSFQINKNILDLANMSIKKADLQIHHHQRREEKIVYPELFDIFQPRKQSTDSKPNPEPIFNRNSPDASVRSSTSSSSSKPTVDRSTKPRLLLKTAEDADIIISKSKEPVIDRSLKPSEKNAPRLKRQNSLPDIKTDEAPGKFQKIDLKRFNNRDQLESFFPEYASSGEPGKTGLQNLGNTCYMNAIIQSLAHCHLFVKAVINRKEIVSQVSIGESLMTNLYYLFGAITDSFYSSVHPTKFKACIDKVIPVFKGYAQQDAAEFLMYLLNRLHEEINKPIDNIKSVNPVIRNIEAEKRNNNSFILDLYQSYIRNSLYCKACEQNIHRYEPSQYLSLPIPKGSSHIFQCLKKFCEEEELPSASKCDLCKETTRRTLITDVVYLPNYVIFHLKRFSGISLDKITNFIDFPLEANFASIMSNLVSMETQNVANEMHYRLVAITNHSGTLHHGHYTAFCRLNDRWFNFDDNKVTLVSEKAIKTSDAYILFYERRGR